MRVTTLICDGWDLLAAGLTAVEPTDFPIARPEEDVTDPGPADYKRPPFTLALLAPLSASSAIEKARRDINAGSELLVGFDGAPPRLGVLHSVRVEDQKDTDQEIVLTLAGTRDPFWLDEWVPVTVNVPLWGHADVDMEIRGDVEAEVSVKATCTDAAEFVALGCKHDPESSYSPTDDYTGATDANAYGGSRTIDVSVSTNTPLGTAPTLNAIGNRGIHMACARMKNSASQSVKVSSAASSAVYTDEPAVTFSQSALRGAVLGRVRIPIGGVASSMGGGSAWGEETETLYQNVGTSTSTANESQTYTMLNKGRLVIALYCAPNATGTKRINVYNETKGIVYSDELFAAEVTTTSAGLVAFRAESPSPMIHDAGDVLTISMNYSVSATKNPPGTLGTIYYSSTSQYAGGARTGGGDLRFRVYEIPLVEFATTTPVKASGTGTANLDVVTRIPLDDWAVIVDRTAAAGDGFSFERGDVFPVTVEGAIGTSILGTEAQVYGKRIGLRPGVTNRLVAAADTTPAAAPGTLTVLLVFRQRWLTLPRAV